MLINIVNKDEDLAKYLKDNDNLNLTKNFHNLAINIDNLLEDSRSLKQIDLCRPISGIKKLIETQTIRKESPDSTFCEIDSKDAFNESKIIGNDNAVSTNNKKFFKRESLKKIEDSLIIPTPQKISGESSLFNFHTAKKENLVPINENIEVIAEEDNNEFLLTGMKFKSQKKPTIGRYDKCEAENDNNTNKKQKEINLPPLLKKQSSILSQNFRNNLLFGKNEASKQNNGEQSNKKSKTNSVNLSKDAFQYKLNGLNSPSHQERNTSFKRKDNDFFRENLDEKIFTEHKKDSAKEKYMSKENSNNNIKLNTRKVLPSINNKKKEIITHTIIDYAIYKSDFISPEKIIYENSKTVKNETFPTNSDEKVITSSNHKNKLHIKNDVIKNLLEQSKDKGYYAPYFSLCKNCNQRNNDFYNQINLKNAMGIINVINKVDNKKSYKFEKF